MTREAATFTINQRLTASEEELSLEYGVLNDNARSITNLEDIEVDKRVFTNLNRNWSRVYS